LAEDKLKEANAVETAPLQIEAVRAGILRAAAEASGLTRGCYRH
jgi:hypothetical protein